jgi:hypothetical protein
MPIVDLSPPTPYPLGVMIAIEGPLSWFSISLTGGVHNGARTLLVI